MISDRLFRYLCDSKLFPLSDSWFLSVFHQRSYFLFLIIIILIICVAHKQWHFSPQHSFCRTTIPPLPRLP